MHLAKVLFNALPVQLAAILAKKEPPVASCVVLELTASLPVFRVVYLVLLEVIQAFQDVQPVRSVLRVPIQTLRQVLAVRNVTLEPTRMPMVRQYVCNALLASVPPSLAKSAANSVP